MPTEADIHAEIDTYLPDNFINQITAAIVRQVLHDMVDFSAGGGGGGSGGSIGAFTPKQFGAFGDGGSHPIDASDIAANPQWIGPYNQAPLTNYPTGTEWDVIGLQECYYAAFAQASTPGNVIWNTNDNMLNQRVWIPPGHYMLNRQVWCSASGWNIQGDNRLGTKLRWQGYTALTDYCFTGNSTSGSPNITGVSPTDIAQLHVGMKLRHNTVGSGRQDLGDFPWGTEIDSISGTTVVMTNNATATVTGMKIFVWSSVLQMDSTPYGHMENLCIQADAPLPRSSQNGGRAALLVIDNTVDFDTLSPQFINIIGCDFFGNYNADVGVSIVPVAGGSGQGSNIQFINSLISVCFRAGLRCVGANSLNVGWLNGDIQGCNRDAMDIFAGVQIQNASFENQDPTFLSPPMNQFSTMGADMRLNNVAGGIGNSSAVSFIRSESNIPVFNDNGTAISCRDIGLLNTFVFGWDPGSYYMYGHPLLPGNNNSLGRTFICIHGGGDTFWRGATTSSSGDVVVVGGSPGWTPDQWAGYYFYWRYSNAFPELMGPIDHNSSNSITVNGSGLGDFAVDQESACILIVGPTHASTEPNWDSLGGAFYAQRGATSQGFFPHSNGKMGIGGSVAGRVSVGDGIIVRDTTIVGQFNPTVNRQLPYPIYSIITAMAAGTPDTDLTITQPIIFPNTGSEGFDGYYGPVIDDNGVKWMELPYASYSNCGPLINCEAASGYARNCSDIRKFQTDRRDGPGIIWDSDNPTGFVAGSLARNANIQLQQGPQWEAARGDATISGTVNLESAIGTANYIRVILTGDTTFNFPDYSADNKHVYLNREFTIMFFTSGTTSFNATFGSNARSAGVYATGTNDSARGSVRFIFDTEKWVEAGRSGPFV